MIDDERKNDSSVGDTDVQANTFSVDTLWIIDDKDKDYRCRHPPKSLL